ncbi:hypothetical protein M433DRAFT_208855 [Acidomyces richmondensis BFW]|nr:MAG: hypothetical protein FE78DRAFT_358113 [Acidomyces sp. 'richmondensis']KYG46290.1 hypothetical protein M433DRAFT_208855 [Acidomyces richmondensis BFW]
MIVLQNRLWQKHNGFRGCWKIILHKCALLIVFVIGTLAAIWGLGQYVVLPFLVALEPKLDVILYDLAAHGIYPQRHYASFNLTSPDSRVAKWDDGCDSNALVFLTLDGPSISQPSLLILDMKGNLVWRSDAFGYPANLQLQSYHGEDYITFWAGKKLTESGQGEYYMLDAAYNIRHVVRARGEGLYGDMHEFKVTNDGTALITVYDRKRVDLAYTDMDWVIDGFIVDGIFQEIDIHTGDLVFEWRASDYIFDYPCLQSSSGGYVKDSTGGFDYFHINSVDKDSRGNYLISLRHLHKLLYISGQNGSILWALGGDVEEPQDFEDISDGEATSFKWQHDARIISEDDKGAMAISLFDNRISRRDYSDRRGSQGRIIRLNLDRRTVELDIVFSSLNKIRSTSQGSVQIVPSNNTLAAPARTFVSWGSSAAFTEHAGSDGSVLCETHFAPAAMYYWERAKSYRAFKIPRSSWQAVPETWNPKAVIQGGNLYVSWNGATVVRSWLLEGLLVYDTLKFDSTAQNDGQRGHAQESWEAIDIAPAEGFETVFKLPNTEGRTARYTAYRVTALDARSGILRCSNVARPPSVIKTAIFVWAVLGSIIVTTLAFGFIFSRFQWGFCFIPGNCKIQSVNDHRGSYLRDMEAESDGDAQYKDGDIK